MKKQYGFATVQLVVVIFYLAIIVGGGYGWISNVIKVFHSDFAQITGALVLRCVGIVIAPLGVVMGYL